MDVRVVDPHNREMKPGETGALVVKLPLPPGTFLTLWNADERFVASYLSQFPGFYTTADAGYVDEDGYVYVMSRTDDIINVAGHRLSTGGMEEVLASHPDVAECAVVGVHDELKGQIPVGFLVLKKGVDRDPAEIQNLFIDLRLFDAGGAPVLLECGRQLAGTARRSSPRRR
jgi:propionyl-CoA synthetase